MSKVSQTELNFSVNPGLESSVPIVELYYCQENFHHILSKIFVMLMYWNPFCCTKVRNVLSVVLKRPEILTFWFLCFWSCHVIVVTLYTNAKNLLSCIKVLKFVKGFEDFSYFLVAKKCVRHFSWHPVWIKALAAFFNPCKTLGDTNIHCRCIIPQELKDDECMCICQNSQYKLGNTISLLCRKRITWYRH